MPSKSQAQHRLFEMVAHDQAAAKRLGIKQSVGQEFVAADKGRRVRDLPERVQQKAEGGAFTRPPFKW